MQTPQRRLVACLAISAALLAGFIGWTLLTKPRAEPPALDREIAESMKGFTEEHPAIRGLFVELTFLGSVPAMAVFAAAGVLGSLLLRQRELALGWLLAAAGGGVLDYVLKTTIDRPRPPPQLRDPAVHELNESYPSGHAMGSITGFGMLGYALYRVVRQRGWRVVLVLGVAVLILLIGCSRIVLRAHWFSDVIGGFTIGGAWLALWIAAIERLRPAQQKSPGG